MLSRVAESIYWMGRQVERAENLARFLEVTLGLVLEESEALVDPWEPLVLATGDTEWFEKKYGTPTARNVIQFLAFDPEYPNSMLTSLRMARVNAKTVRESLSSELFEELNSFFHFVNDAANLPLTDPTADFFDQVRRHAIFWNGVLDGTMPHDIRWHFANLGRLLERADKTSRILDVKYFNLLPQVEDVGTAIDDIQWSALLLAISGFEAYRRDHHVVEIEKVVEFFLFHRRFPRSVRSCVAGADWSLSEIEADSGRESPGITKKRMSALCHRLSETNVKEVLAGGMHQFVDGLQHDLNDIGSSLNEDFFHLRIPA